MSFQAESPLTHDKAHERPDSLDPRKNGPFLDDVREDELRAYRNARMKATASNEDTQDMPPVAGEDSNDNDE